MRQCSIYGRASRLGSLLFVCRLEEQFLAEHVIHSAYGTNKHRFECHVAVVRDLVIRYFYQLLLVQHNLVSWSKQKKKKKKKTDSL